MKFQNSILKFVRMDGQSQINMPIQLFQTLGYKNALFKVSKIRNPFFVLE